MVIENKEYTNLISKIEAIKNNALNTKLTIGKHKGETFEEVMSYDIQYIYWLIRETNLNIDPRTIGLKMPTKDSILTLLESTFEDGKFIYHKRIVHPAQYDNWNLGHYGSKKAAIYISKQFGKLLFEVIYGGTNCNWID